MLGIMRINMNLMKVKQNNEKNGSKLEMNTTEGLSPTF